MEVTPYHAARDYFDEDCPFDFEDSLRLHFLYGGHVHATPEVMVMAYPCQKALIHVHSRGPHVANPHKQLHDCWFIYFVSGKVGDAVKFFPYKLPWIAWQRLDGIKVLRFDTVVAMLEQWPSHDYRSVKEKS